MKKLTAQEVEQAKKDGTFYKTKEDEIVSRHIDAMIEDLEAINFKGTFDCDLYCFIYKLHGNDGIPILSRLSFIDKDKKRKTQRGT